MDKNEQSRLRACCKATKRHLTGQLKQFGATHSLRAVCWYLACFARAFGPDEDQKTLDKILEMIVSEFDGMAVEQREPTASEKVA